jgi:hypothetical protein
MGFKWHMDTQINPGVMKNIEDWLNKIEILEKRDRYQVGSDDQFYVTKYAKQVSAESVGGLFLDVLKRRWPQQFFGYHTGTKSSDGLFTVVFGGLDVTLQFDTIKTGRANEPEVYVYFECKFKGVNPVNPANLQPKSFKPETSSNGDMCSCIVS